MSVNSTLKATKIIGQTKAFYRQIYITVCIGVSLPPTPTFSCQAPSKIWKLSKPHFSGNLLYILVFREPPSPPPPHPTRKTQIFQWTPKILKFFILHPILSFLKVTEFSVKLSQFQAPHFWKFGRRFNHPNRKEGGGGVHIYIIYYIHILSYYMCCNNSKIKKLLCLTNFAVLLILNHVCE